MEFTKQEEQTKKHFELSEMFVKELVNAFDPEKQNEAIIYALGLIVENRKRLIETNSAEIKNLHEKEKFLLETLQKITLKSE